MEYEEKGCRRLFFLFLTHSLLIIAACTYYFSFPFWLADVKKTLSGYRRRRNTLLLLQ